MFPVAEGAAAGGWPGAAMGSCAGAHRDHTG